MNLSDNLLEKGGSTSASAVGSLRRQCLHWLPAFVDRVAGGVLVASGPVHVYCHQFPPANSTLIQTASDFDEIVHWAQNIHDLMLPHLDLQSTADFWASALIGGVQVEKWASIEILLTGVSADRRQGTAPPFSSGDICQLRADCSITFREHADFLHCRPAVGVIYERFMVDVPTLHEDSRFTRKVSYHDWDRDAAGRCFEACP